MSEQIACKEDLIEELADKEHDSWARWMNYLFSKCERATDGSMSIPAGYVSHWQGQANTPYAQLSGKEKESDRNEVAHILPLIEDYANHAEGSPHPLYFPLWRMAVALEEQNRFNWEWMALNNAWHEEGLRQIEQEKEESQKRRDENMALEHERNRREIHLMNIHEENAQRDQAYREEILHNAEVQARRANEVIQASYEAYLESLKSPSKELVQAVQEALVEDIRKSTGVRGR